MKDEFYIGWESKIPGGIGRSIRGVILSLLLLTPPLAGLLAVSQRLIGTSVFEYGTLKKFSGVLELAPYPHLLVLRPGQTQNLSPLSSYYLVATWKFGLDRQALRSYDGKPVTLEGTLIYRGNQTMIQVADNSIQMQQTPPMVAANLEPVSLGHQTLTGEIVDSKCFLGVMNPGQLTPHRACAVRCISGGIPPVLLVRQKNGPAIYLLLVSSTGQPVNREVLDFVAEPVEITGEVIRQGEWLILYADPSSYRRL